MDDPEVVEFLAMLRGDEFHRIVAGLPGYGNAVTGKLFKVGDALGISSPPRPTEPARKTRSR
jgi:hypothetical protein